MNNLGPWLMLVPSIIMCLYAIVKFFQLVIEDGVHKSPKFWIGLVLVVTFAIGVIITAVQYEASK